MELRAAVGRVLRALVTTTIVASAVWASGPDPTAPAATLEDLFGDTGPSFQGSIGIRNFEKVDSGAPDPLTGYGIGVDDAVFQWREYTLVDDATDCVSGGACATIDVEANNVYVGETLVRISVYETTPTDNDCDGDGDNTDPGDDRDCDDDGRDDVIVRATSDADLTGERVICNTDGSDLYVGEVTVSASSEAAGILFIRRAGTSQPTVTVTYDDLDDGTGVPCPNDVNPASHGRVQSGTVVSLQTGAIGVLGATLSDNGDDDGFADTDETVEMRIVVFNQTGGPVENLRARLVSTDPNIDCVLDSLISIGDLDTDAVVESVDAFTFRMGDVDRTTLGLDDLDDLTATLEVLFFSDSFDGTTVPQSITLDLDLDATGGSGPGSFFEGFEVTSGLGSFTTMNLDAGRNNFSDSDGFRCQYSDPDWINSGARPDHRLLRGRDSGAGRRLLLADQRTRGT